MMKTAGANQSLRRFNILSHVRVFPVSSVSGNHTGGIRANLVPELAKPGKSAQASSVASFEPNEFCDCLLKTRKLSEGWRRNLILERNLLTLALSRYFFVTANRR